MGSSSLSRGRWLSGKESACQCRRHRFYPWVGKICQKRKWQPTPVFLPLKSHGQRSLAGYIVHVVPKSLTRLNNSFSKWWFRTQAPSICGSTVVNGVLTCRKPKKWGAGGKHRRLLCPDLEVGGHLICSHSIDQNSNTWPYLTTRKAEKLSSWLPKKKRKQAWWRASQSLQIREVLQGLPMSRQEEDDSSSSILSWMNSLLWPGFREQVPL